MPTTPLTYARTAGALYLVTHVTSIAAVAAYGAGAIALGVALEFTLALGCLGTGILLWVLLHGAGPARAATFATLRAVEAAVILAESEERTVHADPDDAQGAHRQSAETADLP